MTRRLTNADIDTFITDHLALALWVEENSQESPLHEDLLKHGVIALAFNEDSDPHWRRLAAWALSETAVPPHIRDIANRIYESVFRVGTRFNIDLYPSDSEDALTRALDQLSPYLRKGDTVQ
jgi:hypothetical protein